MKMDFDAYQPQEHTQSLLLNDGTDLTVKTWLPYDQREALAMEIVNTVMTEDEEAGVCYEKYIADVIECFFILKYYTDLELGDYELGYAKKVFDWFTNNNHDLCELCEVTGYQCEVEPIVERLKDGVKAHITGMNSIRMQIRKLIDSIYGNQGLIDELAKSTELNEEMISLLGSGMKMLENKKKGQAGRRTDGLNFAKK